MVNLEEGVTAIADEQQRETLRQIISNTKLSEMFLALARDLDVMEPKVPEEVRGGWVHALEKLGCCNPKKTRACVGGLLCVCVVVGFSCLCPYSKVIYSQQGHV